MANSALDRLLVDVSRCRACVETPLGAALPHAPRPIVQISATSRIGTFSQAPGARAHASGLPFTDPSGDRLRDWMGITAEVFYDVDRIAILPIGFCFPGNDARGGDLAAAKGVCGSVAAAIACPSPRVGADFAGRSIFSALASGAIRQRRHNGNRAALA